ncbi:hypothetical protein CPLU01_01479 [Colletotrichum plurivorum]|uniref:Uncharacterized protein n=1 Tax=Colletotrichum plurivorum TaxID=2175906 RepID=A0A8H6NNZ5_9PEZI|nr:hypothetical protein CPLU01_01479 [Colletotrichum plurivorum]
MAPFKSSNTQKGGSSDLPKPFTSHESRSLVDKVDSFVRDRAQPTTDSLKHKSDKKKRKKKAETKNFMSLSTHEVETFQGTESHTSTPAHQDTQQKKRKRSKSLHANDVNDANEGVLLGPFVSPNYTPGLKKGLKRSKSFSAENAELLKIRNDETLANQGKPERKKHKRSKSLSGMNTKLSKIIAVRENGEAVKPKDPNSEEHTAVSADVKDSTALGKMKKPHRKSSLNIDDQNVSSEQTTYDNPTSPGQPAFRLAKSTPARIEPPVVAGQHRPPEFRRPLFNPFLHLQKFSVQNPEPIWSPPKQTEDTETSELNAGQIWTPGTRDAGENSKSESSDAKRTVTTTGRVTKHDKTDAASPTPLPKKEQKRRGRPKKVKEPATAQVLLPPAAHTSVLSTPAQASGTLVQPAASLAALLGSGDRAEQLMKKLEQDKQMLNLEAEAWHKATKF